MKHIYSSLKIVDQSHSGYPAHIKQRIGVRIGEPHFNQGLGGQCVDAEISYPKLWDNSCGSAIPAGEWPSYVVKSSRFIARQLTAMIAELQDHRDRLLEEAARVSREHGLELPSQSPPCAIFLPGNPSQMFGPFATPDEAE